MEHALKIGPEAQGSRIVSPYYVSALVDSLMVGGLSILLFLTVRAFPSLASPRIPVMLMFLVNWPHGFCTLDRLYGSRETRRKFPWAAYYFPVVALALMFLSVAFPVAVATPMIIVYVVWRVWHYAMQSLGVTLIYAKRGGLSLGQAERRAILGFIYAAFALVLLLYLRILIPGELRPADFDSWQLPRPVYLAGKGLALAGSLLLAWFIARWWRAGRTALLPLFLIPLAEAWVVMVWAVPTAFYPFIATFHCLQYFFINWVYRRHGKAPEKVARFTQLWVTRCIAGGLLYMGMLTAFAKLFEAMGTPPALAMLIAGVGPDLHHYFADGVLWKLREKGPGSPAEAFFG